MKKVRVGSVEMAVEDRGDGPPLLLVHGFPLHSGMWQQQIDAFAGRYRVIAPDLRGFGQTPVEAEMMTMEQFADDLAGLLDALHVTEPVAFCGLSMGGYVAWSFWRKHSERVRALILCDTRAVADPPAAAQARMQMAKSVMTEGLQPVCDAMLPKMLAAGTAKRQPEVLDFVRGMILNANPAGVAAAQRGMAARPDSSELLREISVPTLVIVGQEDAISTPEEMRSIAAGIPGARFVEAPGAGHLSPLENPQAVNQAIVGFLDSL
jgi:pimeloyl-ACP methyl ester carboxylesterase